MNSDWRETSIGALCDDAGATLQTGPFGTQLHAYDYEPDGEVPVVPTSAIGRRRLLDEHVERIGRGKADELSRHYLRPGDILFARRGAQATGLSALVEPRHAGWLCGTGAIRLRLDQEFADPVFVSFVLSSDSTHRWLRHHAIGATMPNLNEGVIRAIPLTLPPLPEQRAIASILGALDDKIELNRRMNETLEELARTIFKSWFVDFDPVKAKAEGRQPEGMDAGTAKLFPSRFVVSELGMIPEGWTVTSLEEVAAPVRSTVDPRTLPPTTPYIGLEHMPLRSVALGVWGTASAVESQKAQFEKQDILFGKLRPYFHKVGVAPVAGVCSTDIVVMRPRDAAMFGFTLAHVSSDPFVAYTTSGSDGTRMPRTSWGWMARYQLATPARDCLGEFNRLVRALVSRIHSNLFESRTLAEIRDLLLPKLISGELRVPDAEKLAEAAL